MIAALEEEQSVSSASAARLVSEILASEEFLKIWRRHYRSEGEEPVLDLVGEFKKNALVLEEQPEIAAFAHDLIAIERKAMGGIKAGEKPVASDLRVNLKILENHLSSFVLPPEEKKAEKKHEWRDKAKDAWIATQLSIGHHEIDPLKRLYYSSWHKKVLGAWSSIKDAVVRLCDRAKNTWTATQLAYFEQSLLPIGRLNFSAPKVQEEDVIHTHQETMDKILLTLRKETAQIPFTPIRSTYNFFKGWAGEFAHEIKENKLLSTAIGVAAWKMMQRVSVGKVRVTPEETGYIDLDMSDLGSTVRATLDAAQIKTTLPMACHDHLKSFPGGEYYAEPLRSIFGKFSFWQDCTAMNDFSTTAISIFNGFSERLRPFTQDPVAGLGKVLPSSNVMLAFTEAANNAGNYVVLFDKFENLAFHGGLFISHWFMAHHLAAMDSSEIKEKWNTIRDFATRTLQGNYLGYAGLAAGAGAYYLSGAAQPYVGMFWSGLGGSMAGHFAHKAQRVWNRKDHVSAIMAPVQDQLTEFRDNSSAESYLTAVEGLDVAKTWKEKLKNAWESAKGAPASILHAAQALPKKAQKIGEAVVSARHGDWRPLRETLPEAKTCVIAFATVATAAIGSIIIADNNNALQNEMLLAVSRGSVKVLAPLAVTGLFAGINGPQDMLLHIPFAVLGGTGGLLTGKSQKFAAKVLGLRPSEEEQQNHSGLCLLNLSAA